MKLKKGLLLIIGLVLSLSVFAACGNNDQPSGNDTAKDTSLTAVQDSGKLRVGMCPEYPPFESIDSANKIVGFDPSLAEAVAQELGVEVECMNVPWEGLISGLGNGDFDIVMSAMSPEEATAAVDTVELSENYYVLSDVIVVKNDNDTIKSKEDLAGKIVGVQDACAAANAADSLPEKGIEVKTLNRYTRNADAYADLRNGRIEAIIVGASYATAQAKNNPEFKVINDPIQSAGICVVAKQGSVALIDAIEKAFGTLKSNGTFEKIETEWLGQ